MTADTITAPVNYGALAKRFRPLFEDIAAGAAQREDERILLHRQVRQVADAGFTALRVPVELGGGGVSAPQFFRLLIELAAAESNLAQALRSHIAFVEDRLYANDTVWLRRVAEGAVLGNAWTETGPVPVGGVSTTITRDGDDYRVDGTKYYTTGSLYADWIQTGARTDDGEDVIALVRRDAPGVEVVDDWDGFGQRLTASGTSVFRNVLVPAGDVIIETDHPPYDTGVYQLIHVATLAGIARAAVRDVAAEVRGRTRTFSHGNGTRPSEDIQVQQVVGEVSALAFASEAAALRVADLVQEAYEAHLDLPREDADSAAIAVEFASSQAQIVVTEQVQRAASTIFNALGASSTRKGLQLDRHWRNARTVSSHNPVIYKSRIVGDWEINGTVPEFVWRAGNAPGTTSTGS
ncbi:acyl-CoA dehydrogenase family protein [Arthrobacter agilis]|uniref:acyl-CoA dehydrogenase family protein n=1 Tax=Arthrobacter agilis TaxID=37921 RepID=UPI002782B521|nr:acyl-CoA dehydrogenase family protein [Arthrobacter agilis]MDQ0733721.1 alkylation response protein AidB-like acyl-CoA dehydrogenase [Arthrobacter agilis]